MIGRRVKASPWGEVGVVVKWEPLIHSMCDALVRDDEGHECWFSSAHFKPLDGLGALPSRREARETARVEALKSLRSIRAQHVRDWNKPWPGAEFAKAIMGQSIDGAIAKLEGEKPDAKD